MKTCCFAIQPPLPKPFKDVGDLLLVEGSIEVLLAGVVHGQEPFLKHRDGHSNCCVFGIHEEMLAVFDGGRFD